MIKNIVILGGGTAGWMSAAAFAAVLRDSGVSITLIESDDIKPVGVGEATIPQMQNFNKLVGIDEDEFVKATQGTFKLGIEFVDWGKKGDRYIHSFGGVGRDFGSVPFWQYWLRMKHEEGVKPVEEYTMGIVAAHAGKFAKPTLSGDSPLSTLNYAFHFYAALYAQYLRKISEEKGVRRIQGVVTSSAVDPESGFIQSLLLEDGKIVEGDFFIDASGFRSILLGQTLKMPYVDWSHWLPCDSALAVPCRKTGEPIPYTRSTAKSAGWQWRIPLQHRTGNGYVYSSHFISDENAAIELEGSLDGQMIGSPKQLRFNTGRREEIWSKNVLGIGLSSGFLEPLESTSIHLVQSGLTRFLNHFPSKDCPKILRDKYNRDTNFEYEKIRDFLILHYAATTRDDSTFWDYCRNMTIPDSLKEKIDLYSSTGQIYREGSEMFNEISWFEVFEGQGIFPELPAALSKYSESEKVKKRFHRIAKVINNCSKVMPSHQQYINKYCAAEDVYSRI